MNSRNRRSSSLLKLYMFDKKDLPHIVHTAQSCCGQRRKILHSLQQQGLILLLNVSSDNLVELSIAQVEVLEAQKSNLDLLLNSVLSKLDILFCNVSCWTSDTFSLSWRMRKKLSPAQCMKQACISHIVLALMAQGKSKLLNLL